MRSAVGSIRRLDDGPANKPGRWQLRYRGHTKVIRGTRAQAQHRLALMVAMIAGRPPDSGVTLAETVRIRIEHIEKDRSPVTISEYRRLAKLHIDGHPVGAVRIDKLNSSLLEEHYRTLEAAGVARTSVRHLHRLVVSSLAEAWRANWIESNPASRVQLPAWRPKSVKLPTVASVLAALAELDELQPGMGSLARVAAGTGMRRGELCGLRWADVVWDKSQLHVHRSVVYVPRKGLISKDTKTHSERFVPIGPDTLVVLAKRWQDACDWADEAGAVLDPDEAHVWSEDPTGIVPYLPARVSTTWRKAADNHGMEGVTFHHLRKLYVSLLRAAEVPLATVGAAVGHADLSVTQGIYEKALEQANPSGTLIDELLRPE